MKEPMLFATTDAYACSALSCLNQPNIISGSQTAPPTGRFCVRYTEPLGSGPGRQLLNQLKNCGVQKHNCFLEVVNYRCKGLWEITCCCEPDQRARPRFKFWRTRIEISAGRFTSLTAVFLSPSKVSACYRKPQLLSFTAFLSHSLWEISGFRRGVIETFALLRCYVA